MHELQVILEDIRNQLAIIKAFVQLKMDTDQRYEEFVLTPVNKVDNLTEEALNIIQIYKN